MTEPRDRAPDEPIDDESVHPIDDDIDDEAPLDDADVDEIDDELLHDAEAEGIEGEEAVIDDYEAAVREVAGEDVPVASVAAERRPSARGRAVGKTPARAPSPSEIAVHVREDWSKVFVIATVAVFVVILLNGMLLGTGGLLRPLATPTPIPTESPSVSASPSASEPASPAASPSAS